MHLTSSPFRRAPALAGFAALALMSACSFGSLESKLLSEKPKARERAMKRVQGLSPDAREKLIAPMMAALGNEDGRVANRAAEVLVVIGEPAVDEVIASLISTDPFVRIIAANLLGEIGARPDESIASLTAHLEDTHPLVREEAIYALGRFGERAATAAPALRKALEDPSPEVREAARIALRKTGSEGGKSGSFAAS